jgi:hypothetical protein
LRLLDLWIQQIELRALSNTQRNGTSYGEVDKNDHVGVILLLQKMQLRLLSRKSIVRRVCYVNEYPIRHILRDIKLFEISVDPSEIRKCLLVVHFQ